MRHMRHMQQIGHAPQHMSFVRFEPAVGIGHLPHRFDHAQFLVLAEVIVQR